jgi:hypothetical protein
VEGTGVKICANMIVFTVAAPPSYQQNKAEARRRNQYSGVTVCDWFRPYWNFCICENSNGNDFFLQIKKNGRFFVFEKAPYFV